MVDFKRLVLGDGVLAAVFRIAAFVVAIIVFAVLLCSGFGLQPCRLALSLQSQFLVLLVLSPLLPKQRTLVLFAQLDGPEHFLLHQQVQVVVALKAAA